MHRGARGRRCPRGRHPLCRDTGVGAVVGRDAARPRLRPLPRDGRARLPQPPAGERPLRRLPFDRRRQRLPGAAAAGPGDMGRGAVVPQLRAGAASGGAGRADGERAAGEPVGGGRGRQSLARRRQALGLAGRRGVAGPRPLGEHDRDRPRLRLLPRPRGADLPEPAPRQRALRRLPFERRRQRLSRAAAAGSGDLGRGAVVPQLRAGAAPGGAGRADGERAAGEPAGGGRGRQPLARRRQALDDAGRRRVADPRRLGPAGGWPHDSGARRQDIRPRRDRCGARAGGCGERA